METMPDAGGPRVDPSTVVLIGDELRLQVTTPVLAGSVRLDAFTVTTWLDVPGEWRTLPLTVVAVDGPRTSIRLGLGEAVPAGAWLRVIVRGTGPTPVLGEDHVPLAGVLDGPPGTAAAGMMPSYSARRPTSRPSRWNGRAPTAGRPSHRSHPGRFETAPGGGLGTSAG
jgi:hypothetical protein